ncbi:MAG TPA: sulfite oxidase [Burkholderiales bacterium]|nr:sulfite oxidase [Burkholderiales bacterium]
MTKPIDSSRRRLLTGAAGAGALAALPDVLAQAPAAPATPAAAEPPPPPGTIGNDAIKAEKAKAFQYHSERPLTGSLPAHEHDFDVTPSDRMFIRNNLLTPDIDINAHRVTIKGLVDKELTWSVAELQKAFPVVTMTGMLECAGSGRSAFNPRASGTPWLETGGMGCPSWTGVRLGDLLKAAGLKAQAAHVAGQGGDPGMVPTAAPVIRSIPMRKAMDEHTLVAWAMNGAPLPKVHGYPLRLVVPGWVGSASTKWLHTLTVLDAPFKGTYMTNSYVMPKWPIQPGTKMPPETVSTEAWPVKSMITAPAPNARFKGGERITVRGRAWVGEGSVERVEISTDEGRTWQRARLARAADKYAWRTFSADLTPERFGYITILARAWDDRGNAQPAVPYWNPLGYFWNGWHRVGVLVEA